MTVQKAGGSARKFITRMLATGVMLSMYAFGMIATTGAFVTAGVSPAFASAAVAAAAVGVVVGVDEAVAAADEAVVAAVAAASDWGCLASVSARRSAPRAQRPQRIRTGGFIAAVLLRCCRLLQPALQVVRSLQRNLYGLRWPSSSLPVNHDYQSDNVRTPAARRGLFLRGTAEQNVSLGRPRRRGSGSAMNNAIQPTIWRAWSHERNPGWRKCPRGIA